MTESKIARTVIKPPVGKGPRRWAALIVLLAATFMDTVDVTVVNIAVPHIQEDTGASSSQIQWVVGGYALAFALGLITGGRLGDPTAPPAEAPSAYITIPAPNEMFSDTEPAVKTLCTRRPND